MFTVTYSCHYRARVIALAKAMGSWKPPPFDEVLYAWNLDGWKSYSGLLRLPLRKELLQHTHPAEPG
jgi:hypothetical protein